MVAAAPAGTYSDDSNGGSMEFWPEFLATSGGREFVAGGVGGMAGVLAGHPLDTLRIRLQQPPPPPAAGLAHAHAPRRRDAPSHPQPSAARLLRGILRAEGPSALYRGMAAPLASVAFQCCRSAPRPHSATLSTAPPSPWCLCSADRHLHPASRPPRPFPSDLSWSSPLEWRAPRHRRTPRADEPPFTSSKEMLH